MRHVLKSDEVSERIELTGILSEFRDALEEEIDKIKNSGQSSILLLAGRRMQSPGNDYWYRFNVEYVPSLPADTPCKLIISKDQFDATIISFEENSIVVSTNTPLPEAIGKARLENGATVLMERLIKCIEDNAEKENHAGNRMISSEGNLYEAKKLFDYSDMVLSNKNTQSQNEAIISAVSRDITYIWGPPGTGKTTVIGQIIDELYKHDRSVLVVSHTNTAVDGAIDKADKIYCDRGQIDDTNYPILRIGTPAKQLPDRVLLEKHVAALGKDLYAQKVVLEKQQCNIQQRIRGILTQIAQSTWVAETKLELIGLILEEITKLSEETEKYVLETEKINNEIIQLEASCPEYADYPTISSQIAGKQDEFDTICDQIREADFNLSLVASQIQLAQGECKKHETYAELKLREARFKSASFFRNEIPRIGRKIAELDREISSLLENQAAAKKALLDYEKKSSLARFITGKSAVTQAQTLLNNIDERLPQAREELLQQQNLEREYTQQYEQLQILHTQLSQTNPSKTREYWECEVNRLRADFDSITSKQFLLNTKKESVFEELSELAKKLSCIKIPFDRVFACKKELRRIKALHNNANKVSNQRQEQCIGLLKKEIEYCGAFNCVFAEEEQSSLYRKLSELLAQIKFELSTTNIDTLNREKEVANDELKAIFHQLSEINIKIQELEKQAIMSAKIVGATLAKSYLSETLRERKFDTVILDEASMASIPALWCASYLAESSIVIVGDFLQLPPIVMADTPMAQKWLGKDIFHHSGMQERAKDKATCPKNFVMLNNQFRMESDIADIANMYYGAYGGLLSNDDDVERIKDREKFYSWYSGKRTKRNVHLIDTESLHAWVTGVPQGKSHSRLNCFSAAVSVDLAFKFLENKLKNIDPETALPEKDASVLIVAPYKPHVARINQLVELEYHNRGFKENLNLIRAGTIHSFQGSEADIVIFDLVIDEPHYKAGVFMEERQYQKFDGREINDGLRKMFNVAVTRAKFKLYIVGNFAYCQKHAKNNALAELLKKLLEKDKLIKVDAKTLLPNIVFERQSECVFDGNLKGKHIVCREESFNDYFMADIKSFKKRLIIYSPFMTEARLSTLLPAFTDAICAGKQIMVVTKALSERGKTEIAQYKKCEEELRAIGVSILHKKGMHEKLIFVDSNAVWIGSLNALSFTGLTGEVMQRHADKELTAEYEKLFDITHICGAAENDYEQKCPICGEEMLIKESDDGGIYWKCVTGDYSRHVAQPYPLDGVLRCKCGAPYVFAMKNEPRWACSEDSRHYQRMRESDLKLEKMAALIPTKTARKEVDRFFAQQKKDNESKKQAAKSNKTVTAKKSTSKSKSK